MCRDLPDKRGALVGVWRPRFRLANQGAGTWIDYENEVIDALAGEIAAKAPAADQFGQARRGL